MGMTGIITIMIIVVVHIWAVAVGTALAKSVFRLIEGGVCARECLTGFACQVRECSE